MRRFRFFITLFAVLALLASGGLPVVAAGKANTGTGSPPAGAITPEQAAKLAKAAFDIPDDLDLVNTGYEESTGPFARRAWNLDWSRRQLYGQGPQTNIHVQVDAISGEIRSMNRWDFNPKGEDGQVVAPMKYSRQEAETLAYLALKRLQPGHFDEMRLQPSLPPNFFGGYGPMVYQFNFSRVVNGIPVGLTYNMEGATVGIDAASGKVVNYNYNWTHHLSFPAATPRLSSEAAVKTWLEKVGLGLQYFQVFRPEFTPDKPEVNLVYAGRTGIYGLALDANTGEVLNSAGKPVDLSASRDLPLAKAPVVPVTRPVVPLDREAAIKYVQNLLNIPQGYTLQNVYYNDYKGPAGGSQPTWNLNWQKRVETSGQVTVENIGVGLNAATGQILNYNHWSPYYLGGETSTPKLSREQALEKVVEFLARVAPERLESLKLWAYPDGLESMAKFRGAQYNFQLVPLVNGIPFPGAAVQIAVSSKDGEVLNLWSQGINPDTHFPDPLGVITPQQAAEIFAKEMGLELAYQIPWNQPDQPGMPAEPGRLAVLVYRIPPYLTSTTVEANTGRLMDSMGRDLQAINTEPTDLAGNPAYREIQVTIARGLLELKDGKFEPDRALTRGEAIRFLIRASGRRPYRAPTASFADVRADSPYYGYVEAAAQAGVVEKESGTFRPDEVATREEFARMVVRSLGYDRAARMKFNIELPFRDADEIQPELRNYVGLAAGMDIFPAGEQFRPKDPVTRAEAAVIAVRMAQAAR